MAMIRATQSCLWESFVDCRDSEDILRLTLGMSEVVRKFVRSSGKRVSSENSRQSHLTIARNTSKDDEVSNQE